jgi:hypothetical protein
LTRALVLSEKRLPPLDTARNPQPDKCPCCGGRMFIIEIFERITCQVKVPGLLTREPGLVRSAKGRNYRAARCVFKEGRTRQWARKLSTDKGDLP